jgi:hypothetical protein
MVTMRRQTTPETFVAHVQEQLRFLRDPDYHYSALHVYVAGVPEPWEFAADDELEFNEEAGLLVARDGPTDEDNYDNADVPEYVFRLDAIIATQLV